MVLVLRIVVPKEKVLVLIKEESILFQQLIKALQGIFKLAMIIAKAFWAYKILDKSPLHLVRSSNLILVWSSLFEKNKTAR